MSLKLNKRVEKIRPYIPGKPEEVLKRELGINRIIKLASNENPLGTSPKAIEALKKEITKSYFYPDDTYFSLKNKLSKHYNVPADWIILGSGSVELIKMAASLVLDEGKYAIVSKNSFLMYKKVVQEFAGDEYIIWVDTTDNYEYDLKGFEKALLNSGKNISILFIANPNNPTGSYIPAKQVYNFIKNTPKDVLIILDEAYVEYADAEDYESGLQWIKEFPNLFLIRTLSKAYGLAGLRVGVGIAQKELIDILMKVRLPFNLSRLAAIAAEAAIDDRDFLELSFKTNKKGKEFLYRELTNIGFKVFPSQTNFLMFIPPVDPKELIKKLEKEGIILRPLDPFEIPEAIRITIGTMEQNKIFIETLKKILKEFKNV